MIWFCFWFILRVCDEGSFICLLLISDIVKGIDRCWLLLGLLRIWLGGYLLYLGVRILEWRENLLVF